MIYQSLIFILVSSPLLNPHQLPIPSGNLELKPLSQPLQKEWMSKIEKIQTFRFANSRENLRDHEGASLAQKIEKIRKHFLELKFTEAHELLIESVDLLRNALPYQEMNSDFAELASLALIIQDSNPSLSSPLETYFFFDNQNFLKHLPTRLKSKVNTPQQRELSTENLGLQNSRQDFLIYGVPVKLPQKVNASHMIIHIWNQDQLEAYEVDLSQKAVSKKRLWSRSLWSLYSKEELRKILLKTKPSIISDGKISVLYQDELSQSKLIQLSLKNSPIKDQTNMQAEPAEIDNSPDFNAMMKPQDESESLFKSPWFWIISSLAAGAAGYLIYDSTRTTTVKTQ